MMRYIAFFSPHRNGAADQIRSIEDKIKDHGDPWKCTYRSRQGLVVYVSNTRNEEENHLEGNRGVILGDVFSRHMTAAAGEARFHQASFGLIESEQIVNSAGRNLISDYWGAYLAFIDDTPRARILILRSPLNAPPCFRAIHKTVEIFFSHVEDCLTFVPLKFSINLEYLRTRVVGCLPTYGFTGLNEVSELELSECLSIGVDSCDKEYYWDPCAIARAAPIDDQASAIHAMRTMTKACVHTWAAEHRSILLRLSGGIDSSVVLSCLTDAPTNPQLTCLHHFWRAPHADERPFARSAAYTAGCELVEVEDSADEKLTGLICANRSVNPVEFLLSEYIRGESDLAVARNASAIFCGTMGDVLFHYSPALPAAGEYLRRHGPFNNFPNVVLDVAHRANVSVWRVLKEALKDSFIQYERSSWLPFSPRDLMEEHGFLATDDLVNSIQVDATRLTHPWLRNTAGVPIGKLWQIRLLMFDDYWRNPFERPGDPRRVAPLLSEPLAEVCLRIPTYLSIKDGWDRAIARRAFGTELSTEIKQRTSKGTPDPLIREIFSRNVSFLKEFLLDGILVREQLLDRRRLENAFPGSPSKIQCSAAHLLRQACTEAWVRSWINSALRLA